MSFRDSLTQLQRWRPTLRDSVIPTRTRLASGCAVSLSRTEFGFPYPQGHFRKVSVSTLCHLYFPFPQALPGATAILFFASEQRSGRSPTLHYPRKALVSIIRRDDLRVVRLGKTP